MRLTLYLTLSLSAVSESQERSGQNVDPGCWWVSRGTYTDVGGGAMTGASLMASLRTYPTLKSHKQDGSILETGWPKVSNI